MTIPFLCLLIAIVIPYALSALAGRYRMQQFGAIDMHHPRAQQRALEGVGARVQAAQDNAREILPVFASGVFVAHLNGGDPGPAAALSVAFIALRGLHAVLYIGDRPTARAAVFLAGLGCCVALFFA
jgi:uncharacterized MAPEG superfamily protein